MRREWGTIGGGAALLFGTVIATQSDTFWGRSTAPADGAAMASTAIPEIADAPDPMPEASVGAEVARLTADLAAREADNDNLRTVLAVRDAVLKSLKASLAEREATLENLEVRLAASEEEIASLRSQLAALGDPTDLEAQLVVQKSDDVPSVARLAAARAETADIAAFFDAAKAPAATMPVAAPAPTTVGTEPPLVQVQFNFASASLTPGGQAHTAAAAVTLVEMTLERIRVVGHTDRVGSPAANRRLAAKRARAVADFLVASGVPADLIEIDGMGEAGAPVSTDDAVAEPLNRSVAIIAVPAAPS